MASAEPGRFGKQVVAFGRAGRAVGCRAVVNDGAITVARALVQVRTHGIETVMAADAWVASERVEAFQAGGRAVYHRRSDRAVQRHHRIVGHTLEHAVERVNLRPVGVLGAC